MNYETIITGVPLGDWEQLKASLAAIFKDIDTRLSNMKAEGEAEGESDGS